MVSGLIIFVVFLLALSGMIFVHELGHFIAARWAKVEVEEFGFGLPSYKLVTLFKWQGTEFTIHALPLGGFVRPKGENDPSVPGGLAAASPWKRLVVLFAGPLMNLLTAVVVFSLLIALEGMPTRGPIEVQEISPSSPAEQAGLQTGDSIISMNGEEISGVAQAIEIIQGSLDQPIEITFKRGDEEMTVTATPLSSRTAQQGALGVSLSPTMRPATAGEVLTGGVTITAYQAATIAYLPVGLIQGAIAPGEARVIGFKGIYDLFGIAVQEDVQTRQEASSASETARPPSNWTLNLIGLLSVSLGIMNLLPIPALDGGRILFTLPEILFRKRIPTEWENVVNGMAMLLLIGLMVFINVMDFVRPATLPTP
jgi:regulator of sigma E protease